MSTQTSEDESGTQLHDLRIGADVGGTFTDLIISIGGASLHVAKVPSVPEDPGVGVMNALAAAANDLGVSTGKLLSACTLFVHGSTVATNTVLERKGATVGLLTTMGFRDTLEVRRGIRDNPWDHRAPYAPVLVPRYLRLPLAGRLDKSGNEIEPPDSQSLHQAMAEFKAHGVDSIAVSLFNSYADSAHEAFYASALSRVGDDDPTARAWVSLSHDVAPLLGEYERTATTVLNAYIAPRTVGYLTSLDNQLRELGLTQPMLLIQNNGGCVSASQVAHKPATLLLSGPAAGVGALEIARGAVASGNLLSLEIGGTSADVMLMEAGRVPVSDQLSVGGYDTALPSVDIHTIGAGGGTIAKVDEAGLLLVGPEGAGARPGPAAYGLGGTEPTVTDALLILGRLKPGPYAGGSVVLDEHKARDAIETRVARPLNLSVEEAAVGIVRLLEQNLLQAVEQMTLERGLDPRRFTLVPAGGAGPMHGAAIGRQLGCPALYVPRLSGAFCALGMLNTDVRHDLMRTFFHPLPEAFAQGLEAVFAELAHQAETLLGADGFGAGSRRVEYELDLRYIGQQWSIRVQTSPGDSEDTIRMRFEQVHESRYRHIQPDGIIEVTAAYVIGYGIIDKLRLARHPENLAPPRPVATRKLYMDAEHGWVEADIYDGDGLGEGTALSGPAIIEERTTTICIAPGDTLNVDRLGNYQVTLGRKSTS
ncbi:MAG: hydantoinase/oxoprolinase family protein [Pseudomonadota bacterium]